MNILMVHKFFRMTGGTEKYFSDLAEILHDHGHTTIPFALKHPDNPETPYEQYFLEDIDYQNPSTAYRLNNAFRFVGRTLYSFEARRKVARLIADTAPDLAHLQSIEHHISPSVIHSFKKHGIPMVQSVNMYKHVCASYRLYLFDRGEVCTRCLYGKHYHATLTRCVKGSLAASALATLEMYLHQWSRVFHLIDRFIVPNEFIADKLRNAGYSRKKIVKLLNPLDLKDYQPSYELDDYILYFGRIVPEKGLSSLLEAMQQLPKLRLLVVGDGSQADELQHWVDNNGLKNVEFVGPKWGDDLKPILEKARLVVVPSIWYEPSPMVIYQALATGKPVIGANTGGIPDLLTDETGLLFEPGNVEDLVRKLKAIGADDDRLKTMGRAARRWAEQHLDPRSYYDSLMEIYSQASEEHQR